MTANHRLRSDLLAAHAALGEAINRLPEALAVLEDMQPGYPPQTMGDHGGSDSTQPERFEALRWEDAFHARRNLDRDARNVCHSINLVRDVCVRFGVTRKPNQARDETPGEQWCRSCWRDCGYCEPVAVDRHGNRRFALPLCRWCGDWRGEHENDPPVELVEARHRGERITDVMVRRVLDRLRDEAKTAKRTKRKKVS